MSLVEGDFNEDDLATSELTKVNLGTAGFLRPGEGATTTFSPLIQTSGDSMEIAAEEVRFGPQPDRLLRMFLPTGQRYTVAARVTGPASSAFPDGQPPAPPKPEGETQGEETAAEAPKPEPAPHIKESQEPINVIVVADSDVFDDRFWADVQDFMGQRVLVDILGDNAAFVLNAIQNLMGSNDLISLRTRQRVERKFTQTEELRRIAEMRFMSERDRLQAELEDTQRRLNELQRAPGSGEGQGGPLITPEQEAEIQRFLEKSAETKAALREVQRKLRADVDALGTIFAFINIALMPLIVACFAIALALWRDSRRRLRAEAATEA
jgi:ABC-type uncharacterized transport system involved in gliding motility auxiliary subunit